MDNVQFEEEKVNSQFFRKSQVYRGLTGLIIKTGLAKNDVQASIILLGVMVLSIVATVFIFIVNKPVVPKNPIKPLTIEQVREFMSAR